MQERVSVFGPDRYTLSKVNESEYCIMQFISLYVEAIVNSDKSFSYTIIQCSDAMIVYKHDLSDR